MGNQNIDKSPHIKFPKIPRLNREIVVTEKLDGSNSLVYIGENNEFLTGSRNRWVTPEDDNHGFARWAQEHKEELLKLGPGYHYGEWMGQGIQRNYGLKEKRFYLFNVGRWIPEIKDKENEVCPPDKKECPSCCHVVPILYEGLFDTDKIKETLIWLKITGSKAVPRFLKPEGIVIYHKASRYLFKVTCEKDESPKGIE